MRDALAHRGPDGKASSCRRARSGSVTGGFRSSISATRRASRSVRPTGASHRLQRRNLQFPRVAPRAGKRRLDLPHGAPTPRFYRGLRRLGHSRLCRADRRHSRLRALGPTATSACSSCVTATASSRSISGGHAKVLPSRSEIKAFLAHPEFQVRVNHEALREYFTFQNLFRSHTLFAGVEQLPPATHPHVERDGERPETILGRSISPHRSRSTSQEAVATIERLMLRR